jgi:hypothetical protein
MTDELYYPRPANRDLALHTVLHQLQEDEELFREFLGDPGGVAARFDLDEQARALLRDRDYRGMVRRGVHPILVVQLQRHIEWGMKITAADQPGGAGP